MSDIDLIRDATLFGGLDAAQIRNLAERGERRSVKEGEAIFKEGDPGNDVYILVEGRVQITVRMSHDAEQAPVHTVLPGKVFGEFALTSSTDQRTATARALKDSVCFVFSRDIFHQLAKEDPGFGYIVMRNMAEILVGRIKKTTRELRASLMF